MPMYLKIDIGKRGNLEAQVKYVKGDLVDFSGGDTLVKGRTVAGILDALAKYFRGLPIDEPEV